MCVRYPLGEGGLALIVADAGENYEIVTQGDHAALSAELLSLLRIPALVEHPWRHLLIRATREHDRGWQGADAAPRCDPDSGRPVDYRHMPDEPRREIWSRACEERVGDLPYVRLPVLLHALDLHLDRTGDDWVEWLSRLRELRTELLEQCDIERAQAEADHAWLAFADLCSLALCERRGWSFTRAGFEGRVEGAKLRLDPFPLAGATTFSCPCRHIPRTPYVSDRSLGRTLAEARWERRAVSVEPLRP